MLMAVSNPDGAWLTSFLCLVKFVVCGRYLYLNWLTPINMTRKARGRRWPSFLISNTTGSAQHRLLSRLEHTLNGNLRDLPSGYVKLAIENDHL